MIHVDELATMLRLNWNKWHDVDRGEANVALRQAGISLRGLARFVGCIEGPIRHNNYHEWHYTFRVPVFDVQSVLELTNAIFAQFVGVKLFQKPQQFSYEMPLPNSDAGTKQSGYHLDEENFLIASFVVNASIDSSAFLGQIKRWRYYLTDEGLSDVWFNRHLYEQYQQFVSSLQKFPEASSDAGY